MKFFQHSPAFYFYFEDVTTILISTKTGVANLNVTALKASLAYSPLNAPFPFCSLFSLGPLQQTDNCLQDNLSI